MAEKKPVIAARLRNPSEVAAEKPAAAPTDWIGGACSILAFVLAVATLACLYMDWDALTLYIGQ